eukprot:CAMPEP_0174375854 /NCGR_PEP_ID=MMETSP0811_2-20130205/116044_1 /TAXON_ID=73025 ORGANISM="Eutreptiella gymnastica-like, Strain CCMP1594" /NCGR_SAMPLE_ID=MMETSP0811_2 /ASSEMBLY_ACC=CAM_ASM_000667 /LENGTH=78 /DNA_ID=CAMNT_0015526483 /DNA_START=151 /DNA_END=385 /DNA_ORIENTATION=+
MTRAADQKHGPWGGQSTGGLTCLVLHDQRIHSPGGPGLGMGLVWTVRHTNVRSVQNGKTKELHLLGAPSMGVDAQCLG